MRNLSSTCPARRGKPHPERSKKTGTVQTIATWRTNRKLEIVGFTRLPRGPVKSLPEVGDVVKAHRNRRGILWYPPHAGALRGKPADYTFQLNHHSYLVRVSPRLDRYGRIIGVRGILKDVGSRATDHASASSVFHPDAFNQALGRRENNTLSSVMRSRLELAKAVADTARMSAEIRNVRAWIDQRNTEAALKVAEVQERRARFLADASSILNSSFDLRETLPGVARLAVRRITDWAVIYLLDGPNLHRMAGVHQDANRQTLLDAAFPEVVEAGPFGPGPREFLNQNRGEILPMMSPEDVARLTGSEASRRALQSMEVQSLIRASLWAHGRAAGVLLLGVGNDKAPSDLGDIYFVRDLGGRIALARDYSALYDEAQREIAMRRDIEARMRILNAELERRVSDRTRLLEEATREANSFAYTVAHDLRAPLRAITGFCQALREDYSGAVDEQGRDYLERIVIGAKRMDDLIRDLLDYARINRAEISRLSVDLDQTTDEVLRLMAAELQERHANIEIEKPLGRVLAHGPVLVQVLSNLISNATKFVPAGVQPVVRIRAETAKNRVRIFIQDNGIGIAPEHQERIFGIFERLNRAEEYPGTGIGLAIVRRAVERLGGSVGVESQLNNGSTFWLDLPSA